MKIPELLVPVQIPELLTQLGMKIPELLTQQCFFRQRFDARIKILTEVYCSYQYLSNVMFSSIPIDGSKKQFATPTVCIGPGNTYQLIQKKFATP